MIMLINKYMLSLSIVLHNKFDILCKSTFTLFFYYGVFIFIVVFFMKGLFIQKILFICLFCDYAWFVLIFRSDLDSITYYVYVNVFKGWLHLDWIDWVINNLGIRMTGNWACCNDDREVGWLYLHYCFYFLLY